MANRSSATRTAWRISTSFIASREDWRPQPLEKRKATLAKLFSNVGEGIYLNEHLVGDGPNIFKHACLLGLEGIVSKRCDFPYRSGRTKSWIKVKNRNSPVARRVEEGTF